MTGTVKKRLVAGVMGKPGSGKSHLVKTVLMPRWNRVLCYDPMHEYPGLLFTDWRELVLHLRDVGRGPFHCTYRPVNRDDAADFWTVAQAIEDYALVAEEVETVAKSHRIDPRLENICSFGRHRRQSLIWVSRSPYEINRDLTRASDVLITFLQTEPADLKYLSAYAWNRNIDDLGRYEFAWSGDPDKAKESLNLHPSGG
jgi:hypothetical protein